MRTSLTIRLYVHCITGQDKSVFSFNTGMFAKQFSVFIRNSNDPHGYINSKGNALSPYSLGCIELSVNFEQEKKCLGRSQTIRLLFSCVFTPVTICHIVSVFNSLCLPTPYANVSLKKKFPCIFHTPVFILP